MTLPQGHGSVPETTNTGISTDEELVARICAGSHEAFAVLVDRYHARCLRVAIHLMGNADDAEDVVQEALLRAYRHLGHYRERQRLEAWLLRIVVNQCRTRQAHEARYAPLEALPIHVDACAADWEAQVDRDQQRRALGRALATLPLAQREALVLRFAADLSYDEMAAMTGAGVSALKMRVQRACDRLRTLLSGQPR